jgi:type IV pilus assembly protein PilW
MMTRQRRRLHQGFSLIEIMVGVVIGLIAVLVIYQVFAAVEGIKRNTTSVGDAQQNGLLSSFVLGIELANAGNGVASAAQDLGKCPGNANFASTWRPIPLVIVDGGGANLPDSFMVNYSVTSAAIAPAPFSTSTAATSDDYSVQSPTGFQRNDLIVAISSAGCAASKITVDPVGPDGLGVVTITHTDPGGVVFLQGDRLLNMGPTANAQKVLYDVTNAGVLRSTALLKDDGTPAAGTIPPNPLASNVVNMKLQYGIVPAEKCRHVAMDPCRASVRTVRQRPRDSAQDAQGHPHRNDHSRRAVGPRRTRCHRDDVRRHVQPNLSQSRWGQLPLSMVRNRHTGAQRAMERSLT